MAGLWEEKEGVSYCIYWPVHPSLTHFLLLSFHLCWSSSVCKLNVIMSQLQQGMGILIATFHKYSGKEGDKLTLSKGELKDLLNNEMKDMFPKCTDQAALDKIFKNLDANADGVVDFQEYATLVACVTMKCNEFFTKK
ncbi:ictacalcin-like isoform X1 [Hemibagrus wyckioides]|uniref:ictacalcin-like isoform X1 n=2 Tax=Hemibagrus wyckioides TaxID=337641 RepID=UPI00266BB648|nr:ictacalcin-like isoform X1 [Hemibagrus wyckioides]